jgi:hypothetical protein
MDLPTSDSESAVYFTKTETNIKAHQIKSQSEVYVKYGHFILPRPVLCLNLTVRPEADDQ